jgi:hypothetical protein
LGTPPRPAADEDPPPPLGCTPSVAAGCAELQATSRGAPGARHHTRLPAARVEGAAPPPGRIVHADRGCAAATGARRVHRSRAGRHCRSASFARIEGAPPAKRRWQGRAVRAIVLDGNHRTPLLRVLEAGPGVPVGRLPLRQRLPRERLAAAHLLPSSLPQRTAPASRRTVPAAPRGPSARRRRRPASLTTQRSRGGRPRGPQSAMVCGRI